MGNQRLDLTHDEVHALLCGTLEFSNVFAALHSQIETTSLAIINENTTVEAMNGR
jgi:hypothetical protein